MISRQQIRQFLAVVDAGNFSRGAAAIGVTQPSLSAGIIALERQFDVKLFVRERRAVRLTPAGNRLLPIARKIEREFRRAEIEAPAAPKPAALLRLGTLTSLSSAWIETMVAKLSPATSVAVSEGDSAALLRELEARKIDAAVIEQPPHTPDGLAMRTLATEPYVMMVSAQHRLAAYSALKVEDVADQTMIARRSCELLKPTSRFFTDRGVRPPFSYKSHNDDRAMQMVRAGLGVTIAPQSLAIAGVAAIPLEEFEYSRKIALAFTDDMIAKPNGADRLIDVLHQAALHAVQQ